MINGYPNLTRLSEVFIQKYESYLPTAFDESMSILQKLNKIIQFMNETGILVNSAVDLIEASIESQNIDIVALQEEVLDFRTQISQQQNDFEAEIENELLPNNIDILLNEWSYNGKLATIINTQVFGMKADVSYVDNKISVVDTKIEQLVSGTPKGIYATVALLQSAYPTGTDGIYLITTGVTAGHWYYWNGTAWGDGGVYQDTEISNGSVTPLKTDFLTLGKNLFNPSTRNINKNVNELGLFDSAGYDTSDYIPVTVGSYAITKTRTYSLYNSAKVWVSRVDVPDRSAQIANITQDGFIRAVFLASEVPTSMVERGSVYTTFERFGYNLTNQMLVSETNLDNPLKAKLDSLASVDLKKMYATKIGKSFQVKFRYGLESLILEFNELGVNKIIHPKSMRKKTETSLSSDFTSNLWYSIDTDWVSPYAGITSLTNGSSSFAGTVGGNHGTSGDTGYATARNISALMYANGNLVSDGQIVNCDKVVLVVKNFVSASNRIDVSTGIKADSLEETVTYVITPNNVEVSVYLTALEDLTINGYVGLQMTTNMFVGKAYFNDSATKHSVDSVHHASLSLPFNGDRMVYADANNVIATYTNRTSGLGDLSAKGTSPIHYLSAFNKLYSHLVTNPVTVLSNKSVFYSGGYTFDVPMTCIGAEKAYFIKLNDIKIYCVDFLTSVANTYLTMPVELSGMQIEIVEKSDSITCDTLISGKGLKISSGGFGTLKFKIKTT